MSAVKCDTWTANKILHNEAGVDYDLKSLRPVISTFSILFLSSTVMVRESDVMMIVTQIIHTPRQTPVVK